MANSAKLAGENSLPDRRSCMPANDDRKSAIVTTTKGLRRPKPEPEIDPEARGAKGFLAPLIRPGGALPPDASE